MAANLSAVDVSNRHQLNAQEALKPMIPRRASKQPLCSWFSEQQARPKVQAPSPPRSLCCSAPLTALLARREAKRKKGALDISSANCVSEMH